MCQKKPGLRCAQTAYKAMKAAEVAYVSERSPEALTALRKAKHEYSLTRPAIEDLQRQGKAELADVFRAGRARRLRLYRFSQMFSSVPTRYHGHPALIPDLSEPLVADAFRIAVIAHGGVDRKNGEPYINHPLRVAARLRAYSPVITAIALMHDTVEDSDLTLDDLRTLGMPEAVVQAVDALTKREGEEYMSAVIRAARNPFARLVKLSDTLDNSSDDQLSCFTEEKRQKQRKKYSAARSVIVPVIKRNDELRKAFLVI